MRTQNPINEMEHWSHPFRITGLRPMQRIIDHVHGLFHHCYTNDKLTQLCFFISEWMASNRLKLNPSKSEFLERQRHKKSLCLSTFDFHYRPTQRMMRKKLSSEVM